MSERISIQTGSKLASIHERWGGASKKRGRRPHVPTERGGPLVDGLSGTETSAQRDATSQEPLRSTAASQTSHAPHSTSASNGRERTAEVSPAGAPQSRNRTLIGLPYRSRFLGGWMSSKTPRYRRAASLGISQVNSQTIAPTEQTWHQYPDLSGLRAKPQSLPEGKTILPWVLVPLIAFGGAFLLLDSAGVWSSTKQSQMPLQAPALPMPPKAPSSTLGEARTPLNVPPLPSSKAPPPTLSLPTTLPPPANVSLANDPSPIGEEYSNEEPNESVNSARFEPKSNSDAKSSPRGDIIRDSPF